MNRNDWDVVFLVFHDMSYLQYWMSEGACGQKSERGAEGSGDEESTSNIQKGYKRELGWSVQRTCGSEPGDLLRRAYAIVRQTKFAVQTRSMGSQDGFCFSRLFWLYVQLYTESHQSNVSSSQYHAASPTNQRRNSSGPIRLTSFFFLALLVFRVCSYYIFLVSIYYIIIIVA